MTSPKETNFMHRGKTVACGHCQPDRFAVVPIECDCECHTSPKDWRNQEMEKFRKLIYGHHGDGKRPVVLYKDEFFFKIKDMERHIDSLFSRSEARVRDGELRMLLTEMQNRAEKIPPNLLLNELVNYVYDRFNVLSAPVEGRE